MSVIPHGEAEMSITWCILLLHSVFAGSQQFNDRKREIGKMKRISALAALEKLGERTRVGPSGQFFSESTSELNNSIPVFRRSHNAAKRDSAFCLQELGHSHICGNHKILDKVARAVAFLYC